MRALYCVARAVVALKIVLNPHWSTNLLNFLRHCIVILNRRTHENFMPDNPQFLHNLPLRLLGNYKMAVVK
jgi:hypothetical protein